VKGKLIMIKAFDNVTYRFKFTVSKTYEIETNGFSKQQCWQYAQEDAETTGVQDRAETEVEIIEEELIQ